MILKFFYRVFNLLFAIGVLFILLPALVVIALMIKLESPGPVLFKQKRVGKNLHPFSIYKFRSMRLHEQTPEQLGPIKNEHALVTRLGYFLRRFKVDELPQFLNVIRGEMSLIGPRPCLFSRIATMSPVEKKRFNVLPGLTGWAEVNGNVELTWEEQLLLDLWYIEHKSLRLDVKIFWKTILIVLLGAKKNQNGIYQAEEYLKNNMDK